MENKLFALLISLLIAIFPASPLSAEGHNAWKFAVTGVAHPYFDPMESAVQDFTKATAIHALYRATQHFDQEEANLIINGLLQNGYNGFAMWPGHPSEVNETISKLVNKGIDVILITGPAELPTQASLCIATDVGTSAAKGTEHLIQRMGYKGNIVNLLGQINDPNVAIRKKAIENTVRRYPDVKIITQLSEIDDFEMAKIKIGDYLKTNGDQVDGLICTAYVGTVVTAELLYKRKNKRIKFIGIDDDPIVLEAIKNGYVTGVMTQAPYAQAYLALEGLMYLKKGHRLKKDTYFIDSGTFLVTKENIETYKSQIKVNLNKMRTSFLQDYFEQKDP